MYFIIEKNVVSALVHNIGGAINPKSSFSVLAGMSCELKKGRLTCMGTDLELTSILTIPIAKSKEEGRAIIPFREFSSIVKELPAEEIEIKTVNNTIHIKSGQCECTLNCYKNDDYPKVAALKDKQVVVVSAEKIKILLEKTAFCVYKEEGNYVLSGVLFEFHKEKIRCVATDGKRLAVAEAQIKEDQFMSKERRRCIVPIKAIMELMKNLKDDDVYIAIDRSQIAFEMGPLQILSGLIEGEFPEYTQYIPDQSKNVLTVSRTQLLAMLKRAHVLSTPEYQAVYFNVSKNAFGITKTTPQIGEIKEECESFTYQGEPIVISFNPQYLADALKVIETDQVPIEFFSPDKPAVLRQEGYVYLVLPIKIT